MFIVKYQCTSLNGIKSLRRMKAQCRHITCIQNRFSLSLHPKCMSSIIDYLQSVFICYLLNALSITRIPIHMHWHNGCSIRSYSHLYLIRVKITGYRVYVYKYRFDAIQPQRMCSSNKTERRGYYLSCNTHCQ